MEVLRIVLLGKRGAGKSSAGNTLLGTKPFHTAPSSQGVTQACSMSTSTVDGHRICVVDTPGWTDLSLIEAEPIQEIIKCIDVSDPGPHVLLLVLPIGCSTKDEIDTAKQILEVFGEEASKYTMVLFTKGDDLEEKTIEEYLEGVNPDLKKVIETCGGRYHVFNNRDKMIRKQVSTLLEKIKRMVEGNEGKYYTKAMYEKAAEQMGKRNTSQKIVEERRPQMRGSAVESNDAPINRKREEGKLCGDSEREPEGGKEREPYLGEREGEGERAAVKFNQELHCEKDLNEEETYTVHIAKSHLEKSCGDKFVRRGIKPEKHGTDHHKTELKWQKTTAELQRSIERIEKTWLKEKGALEKEIHQLRKKVGEQTTELEKVKKELQHQQVKAEAFEKLKQEGQRQREELEKLRRENDEDRQKTKRRNSALQKHFDKLERAIDTNKDMDLKTTLPCFLLQLKKNVLLPK